MVTNGNDAYPIGSGEGRSVGRRLAHGVAATDREERTVTPEGPRSCKANSEGRPQEIMMKNYCCIVPLDNEQRASGCLLMKRTH